MPTELSRRVIAVVPASGRVAANSSLVSSLGGEWANTFTVPLSATGSPPATHYWASPAMNEADYATVTGILDGISGASWVDWDMDAEPNGPQEFLASLGLRRVEEEV